MITTNPSRSVLSQVAHRCREQQRAWEKQPLQQRLRWVRAFRHLLVRQCDALCAAVARDLGKPTEETLAGEVLPLAAACRFLQREAPRLLQPRRVSSAHRPLWLWPQRDRVYRRPRGLVGIIGTWNYPVLLNGVQIVQALTAGNGVLWKPSELAPSSAKVMFDLLRRAGFPADLIQLLPATREAGQELANADVDHIVFTGSSATGRRLAETLGGRLISSTMELSGCDAMFVLEDADVNLAARAAWFGANLNRGQTCLASRRVLVQRALYAPFVDALKPLLAATPAVHLALESQVQQAERLVHDALAEGANLLDAGARRENDGDASQCRPFVVIDARPEMAICQEASFAPLLAVLPFDTLAEALQMDAQCPYGLGASIFTSHPTRAAGLAEGLRVGSVAINDVIVPTAHPATPLGGRRESGWGVTQGAEGLLEMTVPQVVSIRGGKYRPHYEAINGAPPLSVDGFRGLLQWSHGATLRERLGGLWCLLRKGRADVKKK
jgi:acyl-CoA reductase-like NAD-dependent aldehyde dehydrogenase